jgi:hypothetical protein
MTTLKELNEKVWYRFFKVIFIICYLLCFLLLIFITFEVNQDYHDPILPNTIDEVLKDPEFYKLDDYNMKRVLSSIGDKIYKDIVDESLGNEKVLFKDLPYEQQESLIQHLKKQPIPTTPLKKKYIYESYETWNVMNCIKYGLILTICYILVMECIRRGFYYILIGKIFPKE